MSRHHTEQHWSTDSPKFRKIIEPQLPLPCVDCGQPVMRGMKWQVGHRPGHEAARGQRATLRDVGPSHTTCNNRVGGRQGAAVTNQRRTRARQAESDIRPWF